MKRSLFKLLLIAPSLAITACGYGLKEIYNGVPYNSGDFMKNYYSVWNDKINPYKDNNKITYQEDERELTSADAVFTSTKDATFETLETNSDDYVYYYDIYEPEGNVANKKPYGPSVKLSNYDDSFKYGVIGKLFDGQMFCNGYYANARVQVKPGRGNGFGALFSKECNDAKYMMMNFKCSLVLKDNQNLPMGESEIELMVGLYFKNDNGYTYVPVTYTLDRVPTNSGDGERYHSYRCFGFSFERFDKEHLIGFSVQYKKIADTYSSLHPEETTYHALMLYEVSFPHTTWH